MTERPLLACECVECPSHRAEREQYEALMPALEEDMLAVITQRDTAEARVATLTAALQTIASHSKISSCGWCRQWAHVAEFALDAAAGGA